MNLRPTKKRNEKNHLKRIRNQRELSFEFLKIQLEIGHKSIFKKSHWQFNYWPKTKNPWKLNRKLAPNQSKIHWKFNHRPKPINSWKLNTKPTKKRDKKIIWNGKEINKKIVIWIFENWTGNRPQINQKSTGNSIIDPNPETLENWT